MAGRPKNTTNNVSNPKEKRRCTDCKKEQVVSNFYVSKNPLFGGRTPLCKKCIAKMIDINNIETVYEVLRSIDAPFDYETWKIATESNSDTFGTYMRMCNSLPQLVTRSWNDSIFEPELKIETNIVHNKPKTNEDTEKFYNKKWMGSYTQTEIDYLEDYYDGLEKDFNIITKNHKDYAIKIAKASLHMDKCFEDMLNGVSGADKRYKDSKDVFDTLSKSAQFSENSRGATSAGINGISEIVDKIETKMWIPEIDIYEPDSLDHLLDQINNINKSL